MGYKHLIVGLWCLLALEFAVALSDKYSSRYDNIDLDAILRNNRALNGIIKCILEKGPCSPEGRELKTDLPDALRTECAKCTDAQKRLIRKASRYLMENRANDWKEITNKYDPDRQFSDSFQRFLKSDALL
ncbi:ejaculatory bulb-specific protein 3-like [Cryptotermes secundus]|uniref:ejaculatory bulb-specific protein 3-like n=1 Tax=Cryptotermes secundus TaxID=105785 RepID=UPI000CD7BFD2|nr:ejaculatory bulb-specific protein 3-like [Cryptotermes secundus]